MVVIGILLKDRIHTVKMKISEIIVKSRRRLWHLLVHYTRYKKIYTYLYCSYWHFLFCMNRAQVDNTTNYYSARPNPGAGIGHQLANWIAGYWFAGQFGLTFAHIPFASEKWEYFLGFGENELLYKKLIHDEGYKKVKLPLFNESNPKEIELIKQIISSYKKKKVVFICEQDQFYRDQFGVINEIKQKFYNAAARRQDKLIYSKENFNIAIHVRRGDIMSDASNPLLTKRYLNNSYYENVLAKVVSNFNKSKPLQIYFFSQGKPEDYPEFAHYKNLHWCLDMTAQDSFLHMIYADLLITSKSSFSYKPALLNNGIKVCPKDFWHNYPESDDWILVGNDGSFDSNKLGSISTAK